MDKADRLFYTTILTAMLFLLCLLTAAIAVAIGFYVIPLYIAVAVVWYTIYKYIGREGKK